MTRDEMIARHLGIVGAVVRREFPDAPKDEWQDLASWGVVGLIAAVDEDHKRHSCSFSKFAWNKIRSVVANAFRHSLTFRPAHPARKINRSDLPRRHDLHPDMTPVPDVAEGGSRDAEVSQALDLLTADERTALLLRYIEEKSWPEINEALGHPGRRNWAYTTARRGLLRLRVLLSQ